MTAAGSSHKGFRFPPEIISECVWLYHRFPLSFRDVQELMLNVVSTCPMRRSGPGATGSGRSTRTSCAVVVRGRATNGTSMRCSSRSTAHTCGARSTRRQRARHSGRVAPKRGGRKEVLPPTAQGPAVRAQGAVVTDKLASYQVAHRELMPSVQHRRSRYLNNRAENSHQPTRQRERAMKRFESIGHA